MDSVEQAIRNDVEVHESGCWTWKGASGCNIIRLLAELSGKPLPRNTNLYRVPECERGKECVNPEHVCTAEQWMARVRPR